ncbi:MAG: deoxyribonuclease IV [Candidatus Bathyarchaeia archaeon]
MCEAGLRVGLHVSIEGTICQAADRAAELGCNTMQIFTRNPRGWKFNPLDPNTVECFKAKVSTLDIKPVFSHMPYLTNLASPKEKVYTLSVRSLKTELQRCVKLDIPYVVLHMGSDLGFGKDAGLRRIVAAVNSALQEVPGDVSILLENTAGGKNSVGSTFEDIRQVIDNVIESRRTGICFDTCHAFAAGYNVATKAGLKRTLNLFDDLIGLDRLKVVHLNDSLGGLDSHLDRHEHIGLGKIGISGVRNILQSSLRCLPLILETPIDERCDDAHNLQMVWKLASEGIACL